MPNVSRRSFVELAAGMITSLPVLAGGRILAPRPAYAEDDYTLADQIAGRESKYVVIDVVEPWQVGFMVVDITKGVQEDGGLMSYPPVSGAEVTVTSRFNGKVAKGTTNASGIANIDIRELAVHEDGEDVNRLTSYAFNGSVTIERGPQASSTVPDLGYRKFETALLAIEGGTGMQVPAHPADELGTPYPRLVSFDEWDALYWRNEFLVTPQNSDKHTIRAEIWNLPSDGDTTVELWVDGEGKPRASVTATMGKLEKIGTRAKRHSVPGEFAPDGYEDVYGAPATAAFEAHFLKEGDTEQIPVGARLKIVARQGSATYTIPLAIEFAEGIVDEPAGKDGQTLGLINTTKGGATGVGATWSSNVPIIGGGELKFWAPELPINVYVNPFGLAQLTLTIPIWGYRNDKGDDEPSGWGRYPRKTVKEQWNKKVNTLKKMQDKTAALVSKPGAVQQIDLFKSFSVDINFRLLALAQWNAGKGLFQGEVAGQILAAMNFTITENFFAGPIPVLITFSLDASLVFALSAAAYATKERDDEKMIDAICDFGRWRFDYENTGFTMTLNITPALSVGVGIRGIASISVKGAITLTLFFGVPMGTQPKELPSPHFSAGWSAQISLVIELFLFTQSFSLYSKPFANFYDNWNGKNLASQAEEAALGAMANKSLDELLDELTPINDAMLEQTSEAILASGVHTQAADEAEAVCIDWDELAREEVVELEDGTTMTLVTYELRGTTTQEVAGGGTHPATPDQGDALETQAEAGAPLDVSWLQTAADDSLPSPSVASLGAQGGVRPSSDVRLFGSDGQHVLSAAHAQVLDIGAPIGKTREHGVWCFRVASVEVDGRPRTRIVANCIDGDPNGATRVIEFDTLVEGMPHGDLYDYDFDVMVRQEHYGHGENRSAVCLVILSGRRDNGGNVELASASTELVITHLCLSSADFVGTSEVLKAGGLGCFSMKASDIANVEPSKLHCISNLKIANCPKQDYAYDLTAILFLDRFADTAEEVLGEKAHVRVGALIVRRMYSERQPDAYTIEKYPADWWHASVGDIDPTVYEAEFCPGSYVASPLFGVPWYLMLRGAKRVHYVRTVLSNYNPTGSYVFRRPVGCGDYDPSIRLVWCPAVDGFLTSYPTDPAQLELPQGKRDYSKWTLHKATWSNDAAPKLRVEPIGPTGFNVVNFAVRGSFIFWPQARDTDDDRVWRVDGGEDVRERDAVYQIMACRIRGGRFSDPFVVADLPNDTDMLSVVSANSTAVMEALRTVHVDTGERNAQGAPLYHAADIYYTAVPAVRCVTATACEAPYPFVNPGGRIDFHVAVRNDGNTYLSGCTLELCALDEKTNTYERVEGARAVVAFGKDTIQESTYNRGDGSGGLSGIEEDYALAPGKTSVYAVTVSVPKDWPSGDKKVLFVARDGQVVSDLYAQAEGDELDAEAVEFHIEPGEYKVVQVRTQADQDPDQRHMDTIGVDPDVAGGEPFQPAPVTIGEPGEPPLSSRRSALPLTGDEAAPGGLGLAGAGLAALGAAVATYERRRAENEKQG